MKKTLIAIGAGLLAITGIGLAFYYLVWRPKHPKLKEGDRCTTGDGKSGTIQNGQCVPVDGIAPPKPPVTSEIPSQLGLRSTQVNESDTAPASLGSFSSNVSESNLYLFHILSSAVKVKSLIHFVTGFATNCQQNIWYNDTLYTYIGTRTDASGNKTCYYKFIKAILPNELKIAVSVLPCTQFKYYLSGVEYLYNKSSLEQGIAYCYYKKQ